MRIHRFFVGAEVKLKKDFWLREEALLWQWTKVLRFRAGQEVVLFDGVKADRLYRITKLDKKEAHLEMVTELKRKLPARHVYLFWSLLKKDNNDLVIQKGTELGISNFVPLLCERSVRDNFNLARARKIAVEAAEQSGRSTIPIIREPMHLTAAMEEHKDKVQIFVCQQGTSKVLKFNDYKIRYGALIGPEGGWSEAEKQLFQELKLEHLHISDFTLRAETAAIVAAARCC